MIAAGVALMGLGLIAGYLLLARPVEYPVGPQFVIGRVERGPRSYELHTALPLHSNDYLHIECPLPSGFQPQVFTCDVDGKWNGYSEFTVKREGRFDRLQAVVRWTGKDAGTRVVLVCAGRSGPPAAEKLEELVLTDECPWEALPPDLFVWMNRDTVQVKLATRRPLEPAEKTPLGRVEDRLERLRLQLRGCCEYFVAVVYPHSGA